MGGRSTTGDAALTGDYVTAGLTGFSRTLRDGLTHTRTARRLGSRKRAGAILRRPRPRRPALARPLRQHEHDPQQGEHGPGQRDAVVHAARRA